MATETFRPTSNVNSVWILNDYTRINDDVTFPDLPTDHTQAAETRSVDDFEKQTWASSLDLQYVTSGITSVSVRTYGVVTYDDNESSTPTQMGVNVKISGHWQQRQVQTFTENVSGWLTSTWSGAWSNSDFTGLQMELEPLDPMSNSDTFFVHVLQGTIIGTGVPAASGSGMLSSISQLSAQDSIILSAQSSLHSTSQLYGRLSTVQSGVSTLHSQSIISADGGYEFGTSSLTSNSEVSSDGTMVISAQASLNSDAQLDSSNPVVFVWHDACSTDVYAEATFDNKVEVTPVANLDMNNLHTMSGVVDMTPTANIFMDNPHTLSGVVHITPVGSLFISDAPTMTNIVDMAASGNLFMNGPVTHINAVCITASGARSHGPFDITCLQAIYPSGDVDNSGIYNEQFNQTDLFDSVNEGATIDAGGYSVADDYLTWISPSAVLPSSEYTYTFSTNQVYIKPESTLFRMRMKGAYWHNRDRIQYEFSDLHWTNESGNLIATYEDYNFIGDGGWVDVSLKPTVINKHRTLDAPDWPDSVNLNGQTTTFSFNLTHTVLGGSGGFTCGFTKGFNNSYQDSGAFCFDTWFPIYSGLVITAMELCNSGANIDVFNACNLHVMAPVTGVRAELCIQPTEFFSYDEEKTFPPISRTEWVNEASDTNNLDDDANLLPLLQSVLISGDNRYVTQTSSNIKDSGHLTLGFKHQLDHFWHADSGLLKLQIEFKAGATEPTPEFTVDVKGLSNDGILANTETYITGTSTAISGTSFLVYDIPLTVPTGPAPTFIGKFGFETDEFANSGIQLSSAFFENFLIDVYGIPSGVQVGLVQFCASQALGQDGVSFSIAGNAENSDGCKVALLSPTGIQSGDALWNKGPSFQPMSQVLGIPHGHNNPTTLKTNYSRRWRGNIGSGDVMDLGLFRLQENAGIDALSVIDSGIAKTSTITTGGGKVWHENMGWRLSTGSLFENTLPGWSSSHKTIDWTALSNGGSNFTTDPLYGKISDAFDTAVRLNHNTDYITCDFSDNPDNDFTVYLRFSPDHPASGTFGTSTSGTFLIGSYNTSPMEFALGYDNQKLFIAAAEADGTLHVAKDTSNYHEYQYPLSVIATYGADNTLKIYTDNEIENIRDFNHLRAESDSFTRNVDGGVVTVGYSVGSGNGAKVFVDEFGLAASAFTSGEVQEFFDRVRMKMWASGESFVNDRTKLWNYVQDSSDDFGEDGAFDQCQFNTDFDIPVLFDTNQDYIEFVLNHSGSGYSHFVDQTYPSSVPDVAYHTQIENDFLRFNLTDVANNFESILPRIGKSIPSGYFFRDQGLVTDVWIENISNNIVWEDGNRGPRMTASLYSASGAGLLTRQSLYVESGCVRKLTFEFPYEEWIDRTQLWGIYPPENMYFEVEPRLFTPDMNSTYLQLDLEYPSGEAFHSHVKIWSIGVNLNDATCTPIAFSGDVDLHISGVIPSGINNGPSGQFLHIHSPLNDSTTLYTYGVASGNSGVPLYITGDIYSGINTSPSGTPLFIPAIDSGVNTTTLFISQLKTSGLLDLTMFLLDTNAEADMNLFINPGPGFAFSDDMPLSILCPVPSGTSGICEGVNLILQTPDINILRDLNNSTPLYILPKDFDFGPPFPVTSGMNLTVFNNVPASIGDTPPLSAMNLFIQNSLFPPSGVRNLFLRNEPQDCTFYVRDNQWASEILYNNDMCSGEANTEQPSGMAHCISVTPAFDVDCELLTLDNVGPEGSGSAKLKVDGLFPSVRYDVTITATTDDEAIIPRPDRWDNWESGVKIIASGRQEVDLYGWAVDIHNDTMVVGAPRHDYDPSGNSFILNAGAVYTYARGEANL